MSTGTAEDSNSRIASVMNVLIDLDKNLSPSFFLVSMTYRESYLSKKFALLEVSKLEGTASNGF